MKICIVGPAYPLRGGIAHYVALLYKYLVKRGHDVDVLSFKRQYPSFLFPGKTQEDEGEELIHIESTPILDSINPFSWIRALFWLKRMKPDLLIFKYWMPFFAPCYATVAGMARLFLNVRIITICHNIIPHEKKIGDHFLTKLGLMFMHGFIVQSQSVLNDLLHFRPEARFREVPHPVYEIFPAEISKTEARKILGISGKRVILYFGYIRAYKGLRYLVEALPLVLKKISVKLMICGEFYEGKNDICRLIRQLELEENVILYDRFIPNEEVNTYFCCADLVVLPYVTATQSGIVQIAYHYNRPVVVTRVGGLPEVVINGKTGYLVKPRDPHALAGSIVRFYQGSNENYFRDFIRKEKKKYSWDLLVDAIEELANSQE